MRRSTLLVALAAVTTTGCYTTRVHTPAPTDGRVYEERQWFTLGGLAPFSPPSATHCEEGVAMTETQFGMMDILIGIGLGVGGGLAGGMACVSGDVATRSSCAATGSMLLPFLISSRTVRYACVVRSGEEDRDDGLVPRRREEEDDARGPAGGSAGQGQAEGAPRRLAGLLPAPPVRE